MVPTTAALVTCASAAAADRQTRDRAANAAASNFGLTQPPGLLVSGQTTIRCLAPLVDPSIGGPRRQAKFDQMGTHTQSQKSGVACTTSRFGKTVSLLLQFDAVRILDKTGTDFLCVAAHPDSDGDADLQIAGYVDGIGRRPEDHIDGS